MKPRLERWLDGGAALNVDGKMMFLSREALRELAYDAMALLGEVPSEFTGLEEGAMTPEIYLSDFRTIKAMVRAARQNCPEPGSEYARGQAELIMDACGLLPRESFRDIVTDAITQRDTMAQFVTRYADQIAQLALMSGSGWRA